MIKGKLNYNEGLVLYGLVKYPLLNDRELANKLNLKMTTVTAIKNRLKRNKYYSTIRVPILRPNEIELFIFIIVKYDTTIPENELINKINPVISQIPEFFYGGMANGEGFGLGFATNYTDLMVSIECLAKSLTVEEKCKNTSFQVRALKVFPLKNLSIFNFFDISEILKTDFKIKLKESNEDKIIPLPKPKEVNLTNIEKLVLYGLVNYPELPDSKIADKINVTRQVISKLKKTFEDDGLIKTIRIADLDKLGYNIIVIGHNNYNPLTPLEKRKKGLKMIKSELPLIFQITSNLEGIGISPVKNFKEAQNLRKKVTAFYKKENFFISEPNIYLFSIQNLNLIRNHNYGLIVKKVFGIEDKELK